jgi:hypothetical protein
VPARMKNVWTKLRDCDWKQGSSYMNTHPDFEGLLRLLEEHGVDYMIVGGYAPGVKTRHTTRDILGGNCGIQVRAGRTEAPIAK